MSLTSRLNDSNSDVYKFMKHHFPNTRRVMALSREKMGNKPTCRTVGQVPWSLVGTAIDYRFRFYFPQNGHKGNPENLICYRGAARVCGGSLAYDEHENVQELLPPAQSLNGNLDHGLLMEFFASLEECLNREPPQWRLNIEAENFLLRHCIVMGELDSFYRGRMDPKSILLFPQPCQTVEELLAKAEQEWIDDLRQLSWNFYDGFPILREKTATLNPTFDGSAFVEGADADLVLNRCLVDIKTTIHPLKDAKWIYQLLGYVLLDWHDRHNIEQVAIYFARQSYLLEWDIKELLSELSGDKSQSLEELRTNWHDLVSHNALSNDTDWGREFAKNMGYVMDSGKWRAWRKDTEPILIEID